MPINIEYIELGELGKITRSLDVDSRVWNRLRDLLLNAQPDALLYDTEIIADWVSLLLVMPAIAEIRNNFRLQFEYNEEARQRIKRFSQDRQALSQQGAAAATPINQIEPGLLKVGFRRYDGNLTLEQITNISRLSCLRNGANFSVPGAGKTTVALAVHMLTRDPQTRLLIVAPKNAFAAWDTVLQECLLPETLSDWHVSRLVGGLTNIQQLLSLQPMRAIISYEQLVRVEDLIARFLGHNKVHVILDESHRIKAGERTQRGLTLIRLAHLPLRRDILSGTPMPRSLEDIKAQIDFLWPGQGLGDQIISAEVPNTVLRPLYVRTTKAQLGLKKPERFFIPISMSNAQVALYALIRNEVLQKAKGLRDGGAIDLQAARRSIIRLMQVSSNPLLLVRSMTGGENTAINDVDSPLRAIFETILLEEDSPKILYAVALARRLASEGKKSVIWTSFTYNVERITSLLSDIGALYIHGGVNAGSDDDLETREGRVRAFHDNPDSMCLVANPAACSEGISLHKVCHTAIYVDRSYNAGHYLQSVDRIHRLGLPKTVNTDIYVLESVTPSVLGAIDYSIRRRTIQKLRIMALALNDVDLQQLAIDEDEADIPVDFDLELADISDIIDELTGSASAPGEDEEL